ncbi:hypothetical protein PtA15_5A835 [Puccinia triticina]|uniref:Uncharacterized protein n=1 Tax=Puccinia triticina TaxID=208348 RepID=A0ABY7CKN0_9BASI|nr:uncharacterized protein PtA15_5A835 [Puccinia triticina]WAQ85260.1 hypothetical protein PtA15_5A835 [Puccinia triticina]
MENPPSNTPKGPGPNLHHLGELVILGFESLMRKYDELGGTSTQYPHRRQLTVISSAFLVICPELPSDSNVTHDQHLKQFKVYRLFLFKKDFLSTVERISQAFRAACDYTEMMAESRWALIGEDASFPYEGQEEPAVYDIERTIKHSQMSEMEVIEERGLMGVFRSDWSLDILKSLVDPTAPRPDDELELLTDQPLIQLANLLIPLIKLIRLFFEKISKNGMSYQRLPSHTQMNSKQLQCLCQSVEATSDVKLIFRILCEFQADLPDEPVDIRIAIQTAENIVNRLEGASLCVVRYLVPLLDRLADRNHYQAWFDTWNILFKAAIHNFIQAAKQL